MVLKYGYGKLFGYTQTLINQSIHPRDLTLTLDRRGYVSVNYWPNKEAGGSKLQEMYQKLNAAKPARPASNGN